MKSTPEPTEADLPLGAPIRPAAPAPAPTPTGTPGIMRQPDGRLETDLPLPSAARLNSN